MGPEELAAAEVPYPVELAGVTVALTTSDDSSVVQAYIVSASASRIIAIVPSIASAGDYKATVTFNGETSSAFDIKIADSNFGLITNTNGTGGMAQARLLSSEGSPAITYLNGVPPGATVELDATGLGPLDGPDNEFPPEGNRVEGALLVISGQEVPITYIGRNPSRPGFDKIIVTLPTENLPSDCVALLSIKFNDVSIRRASLPLVPEAGATCTTTSMGISSEGLATLAAGGSIVRGGMTLNRLIGSASAGGFTLETKADGFSGGFVSYTAQSVAAMMAQAKLVEALYDNGCHVDTPEDGSSVGVYVDAGDALKLTGPGGSAPAPRTSKEVPNVYYRNMGTSISGLPNIPGLPGLPGQPSAALAFAAGKWTLEGSGGSVVGPFSVEINVSEQIQWTNKDALTEINRAADLIFTWTGGGPDDDVIATSTVRGPAPEDTSKIVNRVFVCTVKASAGRIAVPPSILQQMPAVSSAELSDPKTARYSSVTLGQYNARNPGLFTAPLVAGGNTEIAAFVYVYSKSPVPLK